MSRSERKVWIIYRDRLSDKQREYYSAKIWPHMPESWTVKPGDAHEYAESGAAYGQREWVSANTSGPLIALQDIKIIPGAREASRLVSLGAIRGRTTTKRKRICLRMKIRHRTCLHRSHSPKIRCPNLGDRSRRYGATKPVRAAYAAGPNTSLSTAILSTPAGGMFE